MKWALIDKKDIVRNIIQYDGESPYTPLSWQTLEEVNDWVNIGDNKNAPEPS